MLLATRFGVLWRDDGDWYVRADAAFVRESCEASLRRLGVETIDLVLDADDLVKLDAASDATTGRPRDP